MQEYQIGDRIAYNASRNYYMPQFDTVAAITPTGIITIENGMRFNKHGIELKSEVNCYPVARLTSVDDAEKYLAQQEIDKQIHKQIVDIQKLFDSTRSGNGNYHITESRKKELVEMVKDLIVNSGA